MAFPARQTLDEPWPASSASGPGAILATLPKGSVWQANRIAHGPGEARSSGFAALDRELPGGGWPSGALIELLLDRPGAGELSLLLPLLGSTPAERWIVWVAPPLLPYAPALLRAGVPLSRLLLIQPRRSEDALWAARQAATSGSCSAVLAWMRKLDNAALRRLQLAAEDSATPVFLFRPRSAGGQASPSPLRLALSPAGEQLRIDILKRRGPPPARPVMLTIHSDPQRDPVRPGLRLAS